MQGDGARRRVRSCGGARRRVRQLPGDAGRWKRAGALLHDGRVFRLSRRNRRRGEPAKLHDRGAAGHADQPPDASTDDRSQGAMTVELAIIGAGPAGMAAAALADEFGLETVLIDDQGSPGGQMYRAIERAEPGTPLGSDYLAG